MKKFELDIVEFDNEDVIATSGFNTQYAGHFHVDGSNPNTGDEITLLGPNSYTGDLWTYSGGSWHKEHFDGLSGPDTNDFIGCTPEIGEWYYCGETGGDLHACPDTDHSYIHE